MVIMIIIATWRQRLVRPKKTVNEENVEKLRINNDISEYSKLSQKDHKHRKLLIQNKDPLVDLQKI